MSVGLCACFVLRFLQHRPALPSFLSWRSHVCWCPAALCSLCDFGEMVRALLCLSFLLKNRGRSACPAGLEGLNESAFVRQVNYP